MTNDLEYAAFDPGYLYCNTLPRYDDTAGQKPTSHQQKGHIHIIRCQCSNAIFDTRQLWRAQVSVLNTTQVARLRRLR